MQDNINAIFSRNGDFSNNRTVGNDDLNKFQKKIPDFLLEIWRQKGIGSWGNGKYWLCLPSDFDGLLSLIFGKDKDFSDQDCYVIAYTAFGNLIVWSERYGKAEITLLNSIVTCDGVINPNNVFPGKVSLATEFFGALKRDTVDAYDGNDKPLFVRAKKKLGALESKECYGFAPALAMGGTPKLGNLKKMKAHEHFLFLAQLQEFTLMDYLSRPIKAVRRIGERSIG
jgi:hypothetical protein